MASAPVRAASSPRYVPTTSSRPCGRSRARKWSRRSESWSAACRSSSTTTAGWSATDSCSSVVTASKRANWSGRRRRCWPPPPGTGRRPRARSERRRRSLATSPLEQSVGGASAQDGAQHLGPRPVGRRAALLPAAAPHDREPARGAACSLSGASEVGLADSRLAFEQEQLAAAVGDRVEAGESSAPSSRADVRSGTRSSCGRHRHPRGSRYASRLRRRRPSRKVYAQGVASSCRALSALASRHRASPRGLRVTTTATHRRSTVSVTGSPSTSHSTAALAPCQRIARDSRDAGPATRPMGLEIVTTPSIGDAAREQRRSGDESSFHGGDHAPRRPDTSDTVIDRQRRRRPTRSEVGPDRRAPGAPPPRRARRAAASRAGGAEAVAATDRRRRRQRRRPRAASMAPRGVEVAEADELADAEQVAFRFGCRRRRVRRGAARNAPPGPPRRAPARAGRAGSPRRCG